MTLEAASSEQVGESRARIRFFPNGASTGGRITLDRAGNRYHVEVDWLYGRVRIIE
jgi:general secretion pathway protein H